MNDSVRARRRIRFPGFQQRNRRRIDALVGEAQTLDRGVHLDEVRRRFELALALAEGAEDRAVHIETLFAYGFVLASTNQVAGAERHLDRAHLEALEHGMPIDEAVTVFIRGAQVFASRHHDLAAGHYRSAAKLFRTQGRWNEAAIALSRCACALDEVTVPEEEIIGVADGRILAHSEAIVAWRELEMLPQWQGETLAYHLERRAILGADELIRCAAPGRPEDAGVIVALGLMHEARNAWRDLGSQAGVARVELGLGNLWLLLEDERAARNHFERALDVASRGDVVGVHEIAHEALAGLDHRTPDSGPTFG